MVDRKRIKDKFVLFFILYTIYIIPIMIADVYYHDDLARSFYGATSWNGDGRPIAELIIVILSLGKPIVDLAPFNLILGIIILCFSLSLYSEIKMRGITKYEVMLCLCLILIQPFSMQALSYRYDSVFMLVALSACFFTMSLPEDITAFINNLKISGNHFYVLKVHFNIVILRMIIHAVAMMIATIVILSTYQPAICMMLVLLFVDIAFWVCCDNSISVKIIISKFVGLLVGALIYKITIVALFVDKAGWRQEASQLIPIRSGFLLVVLHNIKISVIYCSNYFKYKNLWAILLLFICSFVFVKSKGCIKYNTFLTKMYLAFFLLLYLF